MTSADAMPAYGADAPLTVPGGANSCLHTLFEARATQTPHAVALVHQDDTLTYDALNTRANQLARHLRALGVRPDDRVALCVERGPAMIVGLLAILKAGGGYVPLDPTSPADRLAYMLDDSAPVALLTQGGPDTPVRRAAKAVPIVELDAASPPWQHLSDTNLGPAETAIGAHHLAYVIYTSGSTGAPKGVMVEHAHVARLFSATDAWFGFGSNDVWTLFHSFAFDFSVWEIWGALLFGGRLVIVPQAVTRSPKDFYALLCRERVTVLNQTPSAFRQLTAAQADSALSHTLRLVIFGGEALQVAALKPWYERNDDRQPRLVNMYGITETTVHVTYRTLSRADADGQSSPIGVPIPDLRIDILDDHGQPVPVGEVGEMFVGGAGVARGYLNRPELTAERFIADPTSDVPGARRYKTGDLGRRLPDGSIDFIGRNDFQVKLRGFRIELGEIEARLAEHPAVREAVVLLREDSPGDQRLVGYYVPAQRSTAETREPSEAIDAQSLRSHLGGKVPEYMVPSVFVALAEFPLTVNGKLDRRALPAPSRARPDHGVAFRAPHTARERVWCETFARVLGLDRVGSDDNFFDLGGNSLLALRALAESRNAHGVETAATTFFQSPTPAGLAAADARSGLSSAAQDGASRRSQGARTSSQNDPIAIVAMAGRFPGARDVEAFWNNLIAGRDGHTRFDAGSLDPTLDPALVADPSYVPVRGVLDDVEWFDAAFFGMSPGEALLTDPQLRVFLEICWEALERAGHAPDATTVPVGVFGGMNRATYHEHFIRARPDLIDKVGEFAVRLGNDNEFFATRVAHRLDLTGPAISLNTACSTSLVAIGQAMLSLRAGQCDMALAGGVSIYSPSRSGHLYQEGSMLSPDGLTRTFDADAAGTTFSDGAAVVLLKRLSDAVRDGNTVYAVLREVALNNDGRDKASFTAPSVDGQAALIATAHRMAGVQPRDVSYIEAHGTATPLGDPIEVAALTAAFRRGTDDRGFCHIGSVKSNVGHLVMAAGATGVIKTALALQSEQLPGTLHFQATNPHIDFAASPFVVCDRLTPWPRGSTPRLAGVSSFGVGGTNAHAVLEEAPPTATMSALPPSQGPQMLLLSARTPTALQTMAARLAAHLTATPEVDLADVASTLDVGRSRFPHRLVVVADSVQEAAAALVSDDHPHRHVQVVPSGNAPPLVWLFPGQGSQYAGMGRALYADDATFRTAFDACLDALAPALTFDLKERMFGDDPALLLDTEVTQPAMFCLSYALGRSMLDSGLRPSALVGHSIGEYAAAVLAGVMSLADAARLVATRGALMQRLAPGSMLGVRLPLDRLMPLVPPDLSLAAENAPSACVLAGPTASVDAFAAVLAADGIGARALHTSHAFHSWMMDGAVDAIAAEAASVTLAAPSIPIVSTLTGTWLTDAEARDPGYWARHLREPVRFSGAVHSALGRHPDAVFVEVGPRASLSTLVRQHVPAGRATPAALPMLSDAPHGERAARASAEGRLWALGHSVPTTAPHRSAPRRRLRLPTYPFERQRHWADPVMSSAPPNLVEPAVMSHPIETPVSRVPALVAELRVVMEDVVGIDLSTAPASASFIELGLDSLTMTQAALQVKRKYKVPITFRQLMETHTTLGALAAHIDGQLPPAPVIAAPAMPAPATAPTVQTAAVAPAASAPAAAVALPRFAPVAYAAAAATPTAVNGGFLEQLVQQQMQLMSQQLALLGGAQAMSVHTPSSVAQDVSTAAVAPAPVAAPASAVAPVAAPSPVAAAAEGEAAPPAPTIVRYDVKQAFGAIARIHTTPGELTGIQRTRLDTFVRRYVERTAESKRYTIAHRPRMADPRVVNGFRPLTKEINYQIVVERSDGSRVWDIDGNEYVDVLNGFGMNLFGWRPKFVNDAVHAQLDLGYEIGPQHPLSGPVCDLICELTGNDRAALCNTGSEAVMAAMRIARTVTERNTVVLFSGSYHGTFDEVLVRAGRGGKGIPGAPGIMAGMFGDVLVLDYGTDETLEIIRSRADDIAAVVVEPVQSRRPDFQPREFLKKLRTLTESTGVCLVFDEVITGFRAHQGGVQALFGIEADLSCYGKVIGGGFAIGAVAGKRGYMDALDGGAWDYGDDSIPSVGVTYFAGTFVRHPITLAAAHASLTHLKEAGPQLQQQLNVHTAAFADELSAFCKEVGAPLQIRHFASLWRVTWLEDHPLQDLLFAMMRNRGIHILDNFPCFMTTAHTTGDIARIKSAFKESIAEMQEAGFLPPATVAPSADPTRPPHPQARLGRDRDGRPIWFVPDSAAPGKFLKYVH